MKTGTPFPHSRIKPLEAENVDIPGGRPLDVSDCKREVIDAFQREHADTFASTK